MTCGLNPYHLYQGNYNIDREVGEPDPHIVDLNIELGECDNIVSTTLPQKEQGFVLDYQVRMLVD